MPMSFLAGCHYVLLSPEPPILIVLAVIGQYQPQTVQAPRWWERVYEAAPGNAL